MLCCACHLIHLPGIASYSAALARRSNSGIFTLPTSCLGAPKAGDPQLDLTSWAACRLDETPGEMAVMVEPTTTDPAGLPGDVAPGCAAPYTDADAPLALDAEGNPKAPACPSDLRAEGGPQGRSGNARVG